MATTFWPTDVLAISPAPLPPTPTAAMFRRSLAAARVREGSIKEVVAPAATWRMNVRRVVLVMAIPRGG
jgi:hypothetical protein